MAGARTVIRYDGATSNRSAGIVDDDRAGDEVPELLAFLGPQQHEIQDDRPDAQRHRADQPHDEVLPYELAQGHGSPRRAPACRQLHTPHLEELLAGSLPSRPNDQGPDDPADYKRDDDEQHVQQIPAKSFPDAGE